MWVEVLILLSAIPLGYWVSKLSDDELDSGRKWFRILIIGGVLSGIFFFLIGRDAEGFASIFISIFSLTSLVTANIDN